MNKIKITNHQLFALTASFVCGSSILVASASTADLARQDAWISMIFSLVFGLVEVGLICFLWSHYPHMTYVEMIKQIFGKWIGSIIAAGFVFFCLLSVPQIVWYLGNFMTIHIMPETPLYIINLVCLAAAVIGLLYGLEVIARSYEIFIQFVSVLFILSILLVLPNAKVENLLPVFAKGISPVLKGAFFLTSFLAFPAILFLMIFPTNADNTVKAKNSFLKGYLWGEFLVFISIIVTISVLGSRITASLQYPVFILAKEINLGVIFTRLEFIVAAVWIITLLSRAILYFYAGVVGLAQLLGLKDQRRIILPLALIILVISGIAFADVIYQSVWDTLVWPPFAATFGLVLPVILAVGFWIKSKLLQYKGRGE